LVQNKNVVPNKKARRNFDEYKRVLVFGNNFECVLAEKCVSYK